LTSFCTPDDGDLERDIGENGGTVHGSTPQMAATAPRRADCWRHLIVSSTQRQCHRSRVWHRKTK
jgi:hypothetical protein